MSEPNERDVQATGEQAAGEMPVTVPADGSDGEPRGAPGDAAQLTPPGAPDAGATWPTARKGMRYPSSTLQAIQEACIIDARATLAKNFIAAALQGGQTISADDVRHYLLLADEVYRQSGELGWINPVPQGDKLPQREVDHIKRSAAANYVGQSHAMRLAQAEQGRVQVAGEPFPAMRPQ